MARGNDSAAALADLRGEYGQYGVNAEDLVAASRAALTPEQRAASLLPVNQEATKELDLDKVDAKVDDGTVLDASVRGAWVVVVAENDNGRTFKMVFPHSDFGGSKKQSERAQARLETPDNQSVQDEHDAALSRIEQANAAAAEARDAEEKAEAARSRARTSKQDKDDDK
jgi:hypothetical protein